MVEMDQKYPGYGFASKQRLWFGGAYCVNSGNGSLRDPQENIYTELYRSCRMTDRESGDEQKTDRDSL